MEKLKILVVDDEDGIRSGVRRVLANFIVSYPFMDEDIGFEIFDVVTGEEAIRKIREERPDLVLLDNKLPGISGIEVLEYINNNFEDTGVMMITSFASLELAVKATQNGAYDFVPKPFTPQELRSSVENFTKKLFLRRMASQLNEDGGRVRFQLFSVLSHELNKPLETVEVCLRKIRNREEGEDLASYSEITEEALVRIKSMRNLIHDILDLAN